MFTISRFQIPIFYRYKNKSIFRDVKPRLGWAGILKTTINSRCYCKCEATFEPIDFLESQLNPYKFI